MSTNSEVQISSCDRHVLSPQTGLCDNNTSQTHRPVLFIPQDPVSLGRSHHSLWVLQRARSKSDKKWK